MQRKVKALAKREKRKIYSSAQINLRVGDRYRSMPCLVLKGTNWGLKGKAKQMHIRKKRYRCLTVNALNYLSTLAIGRVYLWMCSASLEDKSCPHRSCQAPTGNEWNSITPIKREVKVEELMVSLTSKIFEIMKLLGCWSNCLGHLELWGYFVAAF